MHKPTVFVRHARGSCRLLGEKCLKMETKAVVKLDGLHYRKSALYAVRANAPSSKNYEYSVIEFIHDCWPRRGLLMMSVSHRFFYRLLF